MLFGQLAARLVIFNMKLRRSQSVFIFCSWSTIVGTAWLIFPAIKRRVVVAQALPAATAASHRQGYARDLCRLDHLELSIVPTNIRYPIQSGPPKWMAGQKDFSKMAGTIFLKRPKLRGWRRNHPGLLACEGADWWLLIDFLIIGILWQN